ncbi:immunity 53 family protein [Bacillus sp. 31A1R]|uniref:Immunity 53 family protein n=1 Tax=Robertmurraya mangrovi TaxID=3098077 RepID=A0ABU5IYV6_9BACI|nr:immunity 53 family protein [Bacillus sp. 31A1R]MDZ5472348.1 immunity 53 family protein [Bacillus sp. 31A1R]
METLKWLQQWYFEQCNGDWEHGFGVRIETIDNPGWSIMISVEDTDVRNKPFESIDIERTETDWLYCKTDFGQELDSFHFVGYGGPENLEEILNVFKVWVER